MNEPLVLIIGLVAGSAAVVAVVYSVILQRKSVAKQNRGLQTADESMARQKEAIELMRENNQVLKEILKALKEKDVV